MLGYIKNVKGYPKRYPTLADMKIGETGYIVPWAIENLSVPLNITYLDSPMGTSNVKIIKTSYDIFDIEYL